jgi:tagatose 1,6-diphosphate aldolase
MPIPPPFPDPGPLTDGQLSLVLATFEPAATAFLNVPTYRFHICRATDGQRLGHLNLRVEPGDQLTRYVGHIGYGVDEQHRGHHVAERACQLVLPLVTACGINPLWITTGPDNPASRRTLERLGAELVETVDVPHDYPLATGTVRQKCRYRLRVGSSNA